MGRLSDEYFRAKLSGGRSRLARILDFFSLRLILLLALFLYFSGLQASALLGWALSGITVLLLSVCIALVQSIRMDKLKESELKKLRFSYEMEALLLLPPREYKGMVGRFAQKLHYGKGLERPLILALQQSEPVSKDLLLRAYRIAVGQKYGCVVLFSLSPLSGEAQEFARSSEMLFLIEPPANLALMAREQGLTADDGELTLRLEAKLQEEKAKRRASRTPFVRPRAGKYALLALALLGASFFVAYPLYYRLMAAACGMFAGFAWYGGRLPAGNA